MGMPGTTELIIVLVIVVMIFGLGKLPKAAGQIGSAVGKFRDALQGKDEDDDIIIEDPDENADPARLEDDEVTQSARDASIPRQQETGERSADGSAV